MSERTSSSRGLLARIAAVEPAPPWSASAAFAAIVIGVMAVIGMSLFTTALFDVQPFAIYLGWMLACVMMAYWVSSTRHTPDDRAALRVDAPAMPLPFLLLIMFGFAVAIDIVSLAATGQFLPIMELFTFDIIDAAPLEWLFAIGFLVFSQPIGEELIFRGVLFPVLRARFGAWGGLLANAAVYAVFHAALYTSQVGSVAIETLIWYGLLVPLIDGVIFAAVRAYTRSTQAAIIAHAAFGLFAVVKLFIITG
jgi:hypothetical protein